MTSTRKYAQDRNRTRPRAQPGEASLWLARHLVNTHGDECIHWPFSLNGSGHAAIKGTSVGRVILGLERGDCLMAAHTCHEADCVNPRHLVVATPAENSQMMVDAGRHPSRRTAS